MNPAPAPTAAKMHITTAAAIFGNGPAKHQERDVKLRSPESCRGNSELVPTWNPLRTARACLSAGTLALATTTAPWTCILLRLQGEMNNDDGLVELLSVLRLDFEDGHDRWILGRYAVIKGLHWVTCIHKPNPTLIVT